jgi:cell division protein FtsB
MLLSDGAVEADMLDERARALLNVAREDEVVYFY